MGGTIGVTIRFPNGKVERMARWTNPLPDFVHNVNFFNQDENYINEYMLVWYDMKADYEKHKNDRKFEEPMTECYVGDFNGCYPDGYGLVFIDFVKKKILSMQGYCGFEKVSVASILNKEHEVPPDYSDYELYKISLIKKIKIYYMDKNDSVKSKFETLDDGLTQTEFYDYLKDIYYKNRYYAEFEFNMPEWEIIKYEENEKSSKEMLDKIIELGIEITDEEKKIWDEYFNDDDE